MRVKVYKKISVWYYKYQGQEYSLGHIELLDKFAELLSTKQIYLNVSSKSKFRWSSPFQFNLWSTNNTTYTYVCLRNQFSSILNVPESVELKLPKFKELGTYIFVSI